MLTAATAATMADVDDGGRNDIYDDGWSTRPPTPTTAACPSYTSVAPLGLLLPPPCRGCLLAIIRPFSTRLDTSKVYGWGGRDWQRQRILGSIKSRWRWWWLTLTTANVDDGDIRDDDQCRRRRWLSTPSSSVATIFCRGHHYDGPYGSRANIHSEKEGAMALSGNDNWPLVAGGLLLDRPSGLQLWT